MHTTETYRPKAPFEEGKIYYDGKNHIYGLKSEIAVLAKKPHYCLFAARHSVGSQHDYEYHRTIYQTYLPYLRKLPPEHLQLPSDMQSNFWAVAKAYTGAPSDTPDLRRIIPKKGHLSAAEHAQSETLKRIRVPVEQFFGRLTRAWGVMQNVYRWDHANFDIDFENACFLTNELIQQNDLATADAVFYRKFLNERVQKATEHEKKRKAQLENYASRKRRRRVQDDVAGVAIAM